MADATEGEPLGEIEFILSSGPSARARIVRQQLWAPRIELKAAKGQGVTVTCIVSREYGAPAGTKPIKWRPLTNRSLTSPADVSELIDWYRARWEIVMLFKNGRKFEELQLGTISRIERALALYPVVAWRTAHLMKMRLGRTCLDLDAKLPFRP